METNARTVAGENRTGYNFFCSALQNIADDQLAAILLQSDIHGMFPDAKKRSIWSIVSSTANQLQCGTDKEESRKSGQIQNYVDSLINKLVREQNCENRVLDLLLHIRNNEDVQAAFTELVFEIGEDEQYRDFLDTFISENPDGTLPGPLTFLESHVQMVQSAMQDQNYDQKFIRLHELLQNIMSTQEAEQHASDWRNAYGDIDEDELTALFEEAVCREALRGTAMQTLLNVHYDDHYEQTFSRTLRITPSENQQRFLAYLYSCTESQRNDLLNKCVTNGVWWAVAMILQNGVSDTQKRLAVEEAVKGANDKMFTKHFLPLCTADQLEVVCNQLITRGLWVAVAEILRRGVSDTIRSHAITEACARANAGELDLMLCYVIDLSELQEQEINLIITRIVNGRNWLLIHHLNRGDFTTDQCEWIVSQTVKGADDKILEMLFTEFDLICKIHQIDNVLQELVQKAKWKFVGILIKKRLCSDDAKNHALLEACKYADEEDLTDHILVHLADEMLSWALKKLKSRCLWGSVVMLLQRYIGCVLFGWATSTANSLAMLDNFEDECMHSLTYFITRNNMCVSTTNLCDKLGWSRLVCEIFLKSFVRLLDSKNCGGVKITDELDNAFSESSNELLEVYNDILSYAINYTIIERKESHDMDKIRQKLKAWNEKLDAVLQNTSTDSPFQLQHLRLFLQQYYKCRRRPGNDETLLVMLSSLPLIPAVQNIALTVMLREKRWDIIRLASLTHVYEQVRRKLFMAAVEQGRWSIVKQWADHTLYDDQRNWAMEEAFKKKKWNVLLTLTEHGLLNVEIMRAHFRLVKYAGWNSIRKLLRRGADVTELGQLLLAAKEIEKKDCADQVWERLRKRFRRLKRLEMKFEKSCEVFNQAVENSFWGAALYHLQNRLEEQDILCKEITKQYRKGNQEKLLRQLQRKCNTDINTLSKVMKLTNWQSALTAEVRAQRERDTLFALEAAKKKGAWHIVTQLAKLTMSEERRNELFLEMVKEKRWGVVRVLLEKGVSVRMCVDSLPEMIQMKQWILIARVMEYSIEDILTSETEVSGKKTRGKNRRQEMIKTAVEMKEGSLIWHCIFCSENNLSEEERNDLFQNALYHGIWQALKPLVEIRDATGIAHRDMALAEAIEHKQWDLVDHCQRHYADINQKDALGETALHTAAKEKDWSTVQDLILLGGDQFLPDRQGLPVLHKAAVAKQWDTVKLLVQFHGELNQLVHNFTPFQKVIASQKADIIHESLFWGQEMSRGVSRLGETPLHAVCAAGDWETMYYLVRRGVDPLAVTARGQSVLMYAVMNKECPQRMVAECIKLGFSTHQPALTDTDGNILLPPWHNDVHKTWMSGQVFPFLFSVIHCLPAVTHMLYESGACSNKELFRLNSELLVTLFTTRPENEYRAADQVEETVDMMSKRIQCSLPYLEKVATSPRSLMSMCRLVISNSLDVRCRRPRAVSQLGLPNYMQDYVMFMDLTDPEYGRERMSPAI